MFKIHGELDDWNLVPLLLKDNRINPFVHQSENLSRRMKITNLILTALICAFIVACGSKAQENDKGEQPKSNVETPADNKDVVVENPTPPTPAAPEIKVVHDTVIIKEASISATKMNVLYAGVDNPIVISVPGVPAEKLMVQMSNGNYRKFGRSGEYIVRPRQAGRKVFITVSTEINGKEERVGSKEFRVKRIPDPIALVANKRGGKIRKNQLLAQSGVYAELNDFYFDTKFSVVGFSVSAIRSGYLVEEVSKSGRFTKAQRELMCSLGLGNILFISNIKAIGPDRIPRSLSPIIFRID
ncbi:hypothetical protein EYV94_21300 [Puteibacter caeruleilacunae]|nr:hypothetical protein EYV94_21300 [Puteibacter caeruleilacunae]